MALVGSLSGSGGASNTINVTGSMIIANPGTGGLFPNFPGTDSVFFVSGAIDGKTAGTRTVAVFGGDTVISGSLTVGTGSVKLTSNDIQFSAFGTRIEKNGNNLTFYDSSNAGGLTLSQLNAGGGGSGTNFFTEGPAGSPLAGVIYNSGSVAFTGARTGETITAAVQKGTDVIFYFSGSNRPIDLAGTNAALFGGNIVTSASLYVKDLAGGTINAYIKNDGTVSGSGNFNVGGNITIAGNIDTDAAESKTLFGNAGANTVTIGGSTTTTSIGTGSIGQLSVTGNATVTGNLTVNGTTTTIATNNLVVRDPLVIIASGSNGSEGGIAIFSGSSAGTDLVFAKVDVNTWGVGKYDTQNGTNFNPSNMTLESIRATKFQVGGGSAYVTSSNTTSLELNSTTVIGFQRSGTTFLTASLIAGNTTSALIASGTNLTLGAFGASKNTTVSGSSVISNATDGTQFQKDGTAHITIYSGSAAGKTAFVAGSTGYTTTFGTVGASAILSGSTAVLFADAGVSFQQTAGGVIDPYASIAASGPTVTFTAGLVSSPKNFKIGSVGAANAILSGSVAVLSGTNSVDLVVGESKYAYAGTSPDLLTGFFPAGDKSYNLGSPQARWANIYTGDLHLRNERGNWTIIEEEDYLSITNNISGKRYKFVLEEI